MSILAGCIGLLAAQLAVASLTDDGRLPPPPAELQGDPSSPGREPAVSTPPADLFRWPSERVDETAFLRPSSEPLVVILFKFKDTATNYPSFAQTTVAHWQSYAFGASNSLQDYYEEVSYGGLTLTAATESHGTANDGITGWYTSAKNWNQYLVNGKADRIAILKDAVAAANAHINFANYDDDSDGFISATELHILVVAAANEQSFSGAQNPKVWRSNWCLYTGPVHDGKTIADCDGEGAMAIVGELDRAGDQIGVGLSAHEIGHQVGWPDFYDTDPDCNNGYVKNQGLGRWDVMASGDWLGDHSGNNDSLLATKPAHPSAWLKAYRGWTVPTEVTEDADSVGVLEAETNPVAYKLWSNGSYGEANKEYFLLENRQQKGYDSALPGRGLLIYHVDEAVGALDYDNDDTINWDDNDLQWDFAREYIDVECADGYGRNNNGSVCNLGCANCAKDDLDVRVYSNQSGNDCNFGVTYDNRGDAGNPYPGSTNNTAIDSTTCPGTEDNNGTNTPVAVQLRSAVGDTMFADLEVGNFAPFVPDIWLKDCAADVGNEPSGCNPWWVSPDIWIDNDRDGIQDAPAYNTTNRFWVGIRNQGNAPATNVTAKIYYRSNSTGLAFPTGATLYGTSFVGLVPAGGAVRTEMLGRIPNPPQQGHWCFGATLDCADDALSAAAGLRASNNKACVNIGVLAGRAGQAVQDEFLAETPEDNSNPGGGDYTILLNHDLPAGWLVYLEWRMTPGGPWLPYSPGQPFPLDGTPDDDREFRLTAQHTGSPVQGPIGMVRVEQIHLGSGDAIGGIDFPIWQDNVPPRAIDDLEGEAIIMEAGEWPQEIAARLSWTRPELDTAGNPETIHFYEVHRSTTAGFTPDPTTRIATPAADEDTLTARFQFADRDTLLEIGETYYYQVLSIDMAAWSSASSNEVGVTPLPLLDHIDHNIGNCVLTMTDRGTIGFMDDTQAEGSGFIFPAAGANLLFIGSIWAGLSADYVANRDYGLDPAQEWEVATDPDGHLWVDTDGASDQDIHGGFTDAGASQPRGIHVRQESWAFADPPDDEFIIVRYFVENQGNDPLADLYVGLFLDVDIGTFTENTGGTDAGRRTAYITGGSGDLHAGVRSLIGDPQPDPLSNVTLVDNSVHVHPQGHMLDPDKWGFLTAAGPEYVLAEATAPEDYSLLVSIGPITLAPGAINEVPFALIGGEGLADLLANADRAQAAYAPTTDADGAMTVPPPVTRLLPNAPNPFNPMTVIRFDLAAPGEITLAIYDVRGRLVRTLLAGKHAAGRRTTTWDGRDMNGRRMSSGVYFLYLDAGTREDTRRIVLLK